MTSNTQGIPQNKARQAIRQLPEDQRAILELRLAGLTPQDITRVTGIACDTIQTVTRAALRTVNFAMA